MFPGEDFYGDLEFEISDGGFDKVKICNVVPVFSGENFPCPKCASGMSELTANSFLWTSGFYAPLYIRTSANRGKRETFIAKFVKKIISFIIIAQI